MRTVVFAGRCSREILRDRVSVISSLGFPLVVLLLLTLIQANVPVELFGLASLTPGIAVFGLSFISLFSATLISKDRSSSFMARLLASPLRASDFIAGYSLPLLPMSMAQAAICYAVAILLGLAPSLNMLAALLTLLPAALFFIAVGLLCGTLLNDKQVGGVCGALLTNLTAWLSGTWFDVEMVGGVFKAIAEALPFLHMVRAGRAALSGDWAAIFPALWWVIAWAVAASLLAVFVFRAKMRRA